MLTKLKIKTHQCGQIWIGSDFHFHHDRDFIWGPRGFTNVNQNDNYILDAFNTYVKEGDIFIYLGDFALNTNDKEVRMLFNTVAKNTKKFYYVWGNHEGPTGKIYHDDLNRKMGISEGYMYPFTTENVTFLGNLVQIGIDDTIVSLCHFPMSLWDKSHHGTYNLCGHSHGSFDYSLPESSERCLDVGVDVAMKHVGRPFFHWKEIQKIMESKVIQPKDHHNSKTT